MLKLGENRGNLGGNFMDIEAIARVCHEANRELCRSVGDFSQVSWDDAPDEVRQSAVSGVKHHLANPDDTGEDSHNAWISHKRENGWRYGEVKDFEKKTHPCFVPYSQLSAHDRSKDHLFAGIIRALAGFLDKGDILS